MDFVRLFDSVVPAVDPGGLTKKLFLTNADTNCDVQQGRFCCHNNSFNVTALVQRGSLLNYVIPVAVILSESTEST